MLQSSPLELLLNYPLTLQINIKSFKEDKKNAKQPISYFRLLKAWHKDLSSNIQLIDFSNLDKINFHYLWRFALKISLEINMNLQTLDEEKDNSR